MHKFYRVLPLIFLLGFTFGCDETKTTDPDSGDVVDPDINKPDINNPGVDDKEHLHLTNGFEIKYFLDKDFKYEIDENSLNFIAPGKSIYVKCVVDTTNADDKDYEFSYLIEIDNMSGFSLEHTKGGYSPVTVNPPKANIDGTVYITVDDITFLQPAASEHKITEFTFLISKENTKSKDNVSLIDEEKNKSSTLKVYRKLPNSKNKHLGQFDSMLSFDDEKAKSVVPTPTFVAKNNSIEVTLNQNMSELSKEQVEVYYGYDGDINNNRYCDRKKDDNNIYVISDINNHKTVQLTIRTTVATETDYKKEFNLARLETPVMSYENMTLSRNAVEHATNYGLEYSVNNGDFAYLDTTFSELQCPLKSLINDAGTYSFRLEAYTNQDINNDYTGIVYFESYKSEVVSVRKLAAPVITRKPGSRKLEWEHILYADVYEIYVNGELHTTTENNYFEIGSSFDGKRIEIRSISNNKNIIKSDLSEKFMVNQA